jgi:uncharacterized protein YndB with AHSA1/START domain
MDETTIRRREFTMTRVLDAPPELVFKAYTDPDQLARWWGPEGITTPRSSIELDPRPGGAFRVTMVSDADGSEFPSEMEFRVVEPYTRLAYGWEGQRGLGSGEVTVTFNDLDGRTELVTHFVGESTDEMAAMAQAGWTSQLDKLQALLAQS